MTRHDFAIEHFRVMEKVARNLKEVEAELLTSEYRGDSFGLWWFTLRKQGKKYRLVYDGRDSRLSFEHKPSSNRLHGILLTDWTELAALFVRDCKDIALDVLIMQLIRAGISKVGNN